MKKILSVLSLFLFPAVGIGACGDFYDTPLTTLRVINLICVSIKINLLSL
jgi:hypothetical protein